MKITSAMLRKKGACGGSQIALFKAEWPDGCEVSIETIRRAYELGLDVEWATKRLIGIPYLSTYQETNKQNWQVYWNATAPLRWNNQGTSAQNEMAYLKATAGAWMAYTEADAQALMMIIEAMERDQIVENSPTAPIDAR